MDIDRRHLMKGLFAGGALLALGLFLKHIDRYGDPLRESAKKLELELKSSK